MPRSPSWLAVGVRLFFLSLLALVVLLGTGLLFAGLLALVEGGSIGSSTNLSIGLVCGLIAWLFVAVFHLRKETLTVPAPDGDRLLDYARLLLTEMGYEVQTPAARQLSTRPRFQSLLFGGGIQVGLQGAQAQLSGPKVCVELLRNRIRFLSHLGIVQQALREPHRGTERLIKRVEMRIRVKAADLAEVRTNVIDVLQKHADVVCEVHLLAQSEVGIPESVLDCQVKHALNQKGIESTLHKHFVQLHRPLSNGEVVVGEAV
jgi:hypothetical protein